MIRDDFKAVRIYTDGSCKGNPGPGGWAYTIYNVLNATTPLVKVSGSEEKSTNNKMEMQAVIEALKEIPRNPNLNVKIFTDSQLIVLTMQGTYRKNKNKKLWAQIDEHIKGKNISFFWVKGHNGNKFNEEVDKMAQKAAKDKQQEMLDCR